MKNIIPIILTFTIFFSTSSLFAQYNFFSGQDIFTGNSQTQEEKKLPNKKEEFKPRVAINVQAMYAFLDTDLRFSTPSGLLSFQVNFEDNLKMVERSFIISGSMVLRLNKGNGIYAMYYRLNRKHNFVLQDDIIVPGDTLAAGSKVSPFFNTEVYSLGYLFTILQKEDLFLGSFINLYFMNIYTGFESNVSKFDKRYRFLAPFPNFGLITDYVLYEWIRLSGSIGIFFVNEINGVGGKVNDFNFAVTFLPTEWLGVSIGFQVFDILVYQKLDSYKMEINYNFKGPSFNMNIKF
jgi:hypothetical protein